MLLDTPLAYGSTYAREVAFPDELWVERMADSSGWLAFEGELPVGSVTFFQPPDQPDDEAYLVAMWVASRARGRGVARRARRAPLLDHAAAPVCGRVMLDVADDNERAIGFYERIGFARTGRTGALPAPARGDRVRDGAGAQRPASRLWVNTQQPRDGRPLGRATVGP